MKILTDGNWRTPIGFYNYCEAGIRIREDQKAKEKEWEGIKEQERTLVLNAVSRKPQGAKKPTKASEIIQNTISHLFNKASTGSEKKISSESNLVEREWQERLEFLHSDWQHWQRNLQTLNGDSDPNLVESMTKILAGCKQLLDEHQVKKPVSIDSSEAD